MSYRRRDFRPDSMPERMQRVDIREHFGLHVPTPRSRRFSYCYYAQTTSATGRAFTDSHTVRQRRYNKQVIRDALRGED